MSQSNIIFGALFVAFLVFITVRGELPTYISLLRGSGQAPKNDGSVSSIGNLSTLPDLSDYEASQIIDIFGGQ